MKRIVKEIYLSAHSDWKGEFMALDDHVKDAAVRRYIFMYGIGQEIWPECCSGAEDLLTTTLYSDPIRFFAIFKVLVSTAGDYEQFKSEAIDREDAEKLKAAVDSDDALEAAKIIGDAAYGYCETALREACRDWFYIVRNEANAEMATDFAITEYREARA